MPGVPPGIFYVFLSGGPDPVGFPVYQKTRY
jgi:hypothetical protein